MRSIIHSEGVLVTNGMVRRLKPCGYKGEQGGSHEAACDRY
jgi:hypothetical protein